MNKSQIGVVVPTLNSASTLDWTLCSLRNQRDTALDIIVVDSGSDDETLEICRRWAVQTIYVPPGNMYRAINSGLQRMDTEWVTYLNSDDIVYPSSYARLMAHSKRQNATLVYGDSDFIDIEGRFLFALKAPSPRGLGALLQHGEFGFTQPAAIYRRSAFQELGGFDQRFRYIADYDFFSRLILSGRRVAKLEGPAVTAFRRHNSQLSNQCATAMAGEWKSIRSSGRVKASPRTLLELICWYIQNAPNYLWRFTSGRAWPPRLFRRTDRSVRALMLRRP
jgi:glycosyltransferase involved in cell wall biosynthesis